MLGDLFKFSNMMRELRLYGGSYILADGTTYYPMSEKDRFGSKYALAYNNPTSDEIFGEVYVIWSYKSWQQKLTHN